MKVKKAVSGGGPILTDNSNLVPLFCFNTSDTKILYAMQRCGARARAQGLACYVLPCVQVNMHLLSLDNNAADPLGMYKAGHTDRQTTTHTHTHRQTQQRRRPSGIRLNTKKQE